MKSTLIILAWIITTVGLFLGLLILDFYWNEPAWEPEGDSIARFLVAWLAAMVVAFWFLSRASVNRATRMFSFLICLGLFALAIHVLPAEPVKSGLFARPSASPVWFRGGLALILAAPGIFWVLGWVRLRKPVVKQETAGESPATGR
jgi:hypothetical protein